jgi:hypothetical protein
MSLALCCSCAELLLTCLVGLPPLSDHHLCAAVCLGLEKPALACAALMRSSGCCEFWLLLWELLPPAWPLLLW